MVSVSVDELVELGRGGVLVLPNGRAAGELRRALGARGAVQAEVLSWGQWTASRWSELVVTGAETRLLLNPAQEQSLWREIIAEDASVAGLGSLDSLAEMAASGWALAAAYEATGKLKGFAGTHDSRVFAEWAEAFSRRCGAKGYLPAAALEDALRLHAERGALVVEGAVELVGFEELRPAQGSLIKALLARAVVVNERKLRAEVRGLGAAVVAPTEREELELAARWVRGFLEQRPGARVAMLVPGLKEERAELEDILREVLAPELQDVGADLSSRPWEMAGGVALGEVAMIADAMALAKWVESALPVAQVSALLLSPYLGHGEERNAAARFDAKTLRRELLLRSEIGIAAVLAMLDRTDGSLLGWVGSVQTYLKRDGDRGKTRGYAEWMEFVRGLGTAAGWPGDRALKATEFAVTQAWESALDTVATLDFSGRRVSYATALEALELQLQTAVIATPATGAAVQVMGPREAEGSVWDAVVFLRATDANLPAVERVHPLLPWALQRSLKMPGSDPAMAADRARSFTEGLLERAGTVLFTSAAEDGSGKLRVSPIVAELGVETVAAEELVSATDEVEPVMLEARSDDSLLPALPSGHVKGGASVLKLQAACGFLAFAQLRLLAGEPESGELGLDAGQSGTVLHKAMQAFWKEVKTQEALRSMSPRDRDARLMEAIDASLPSRLRAESGWDLAYVGVVKQRFLQVLRQWLEMELERGPFEVIAEEDAQEISVGPLTLSVRMDRIDKVEGGFVLVDYKSGTAGDPKEWDGERPDDAQLPLYALHYQEEELKGLLFAKVRVGKEMKWTGVQAEAGVLPKASARNTRDLGLLVEEWRGTLTVLAEQFAEGVADVRPKSYKINCARCGQRLLCRLDRVTLLDAGGDEEENAEDLDG